MTKLEKKALKPRVLDQGSSKWMTTRYTLSKWMTTRTLLDISRMRCCHALI